MNYVVDFDSLPKDARTLVHCIDLLEDHKELSLQEVLKRLGENISNIKKKALATKTDKKFDLYVAEAEQNIEVLNMLKQCFYEESVSKSCGNSGRVQQPSGK